MNVQGPLLGSARRLLDSEGEGCDADPIDDFRMGLHIGSVFILLAASAIGCFAPMILRRWTGKTLQVVLKVGTFFAFGTIISTSLIHMIGPANEELSSPCLPDSWNDKYESWAYLFAIIAMFFMQGFDFFVVGLTRKGQTAGHSHGSIDVIDEAAGDSGTELRTGAAAKLVPGGGAGIDDAADALGHGADLPGRGHPGGAQGAYERFPSTAEGSAAGGKGAADDGAKAALEDADSAELGSSPPGCGGRGKDGLGRASALRTSSLKHAVSSEAAELGSSEDEHRTHPLSVFLLEAGIVFHSVVIGITLGVTSGSAFVTLLIVLCFHQFMEGFALGFASVHSGISTASMLLVGAIYSLTTPIGVAVGIGIRHSYNGNDTSTLLVQGIFDAISGGILLYVGLAQLLTHHFTHNAWIHRQSFTIKALSFLALWGGSAIMVVIGKWA